MIQSLMFIHIHEQPPKPFTAPMLEEVKQKLPNLTTFDFDNFSEESIRQYGLQLLQQSHQAAIVVAVQAKDAPISGLSSFFNRLLKQQPESLLLLLQGEQPLLHKMMKTIGGEHFQHNLPEQELSQKLHEFFSRL